MKEDPIKITNLPRQGTLKEVRLILDQDKAKMSYHGLGGWDLCLPSCSSIQLKQILFIPSTFTTQNSLAV